MKFVVDAQLPRRLAFALQTAGHDAIHTLDLPNGNATTDAEINSISERDQRIVITKDADFVNSFVLAQRPYKLLLISTGNITNVELDALFLSQLTEIIASFEQSYFIELNRTALIVHM
ncbi:MAG: DUF5615 family PIN-like protein [Anaerolineae bacterium]